jgi:arylsulfatase A-like enzyme
MALGEGDRWFRHDGIDEADLRVPWVARWPGHLPAGVQITEPVEVGDVAPTMLDWLGLDVPSEWTGTPAMDGRAIVRSVAFEDGGRVAAVRSGGGTWIHRERGASDAWTGDHPQADLLGDLLAERARELIEGTVTTPELSPAALRWLEDQGARVDP